MIELPREALLTSLGAEAAKGHLLVVGEPGAGKTWLLNTFVDQREKAGDGVVYLKAGDYGSNSVSELLKSLPTENFLATLKTFPGDRKLLVIDSLDSLRADSSQRAFRDLIRVCQSDAPEFTIVASIRTFDMQQSMELQTLFPPIASSEYRLAGVSAHHLLVDVLTEAELAQATKSNEPLSAIVSAVSPTVRALLRNPFNLWLVQRLIDARSQVDWLSTIQSEVQLLDGYWKARVQPRGDSAATLLTHLTEGMVRAQSMSLASRDVPDADLSSPSFDGLLSDEILSRSETRRISYSHNIFFDFAVSKLLMDERTALDFLLAAPARSIFYRPSVSYFMARLWFRVRPLFWEVAKQFSERRPGVPALVAITAARAILDLTQTNDDLSPIFEMPQELRIRVIAFLLRAIQAMNGLESKNRYVWLYFLILSLKFVDKQFLNESVAVVGAAFEGARSKEEIKLLTLATISLLRWIWDKAGTEPDISDARNLADFAAARLIPIVMQNYATATVEAKAILTEALGRFDNPRSSANEAFRIASNIEFVIHEDPELASTIYSAIFGHEETSKDKTQFGSVILPMHSFRSQDFELSYYVLGTKFRQLAVRDPVVAAKMVAVTVAAEVRRKEGDTIKTLRAYQWTFSFLGKTMPFNSDRSEIWDRSYRDHTAIQLIDQLLYSLKAQLESGELSRDGVRLVLCELGQANTFAVTWKRILTYASHTPEFLAVVPDLLRVPELLAAPETTEAAAAAISKAYEQDLFAPEDFGAIQDAILEIPKLPLADIFRDPLYVRDQLLRQIPVDKRGAAATAALVVRKEKAEIQYPTGFFQGGGAVWGPDEEDGWLKRQGVQTDKPENRALLDATKALKSFEGRFLNQTQVPSAEEAEEVKENLWKGYELAKDNSTADERVVTDSLTTVAAVAKSILRNKELAIDADVVKKCKTIVAYAAVYPLPSPSADADANFDRPAWSPTPKIEAAQGLMNYLFHCGSDEQMESLVVALSTDANPAVRLQITMSLVYLYENNREFFWKIADDRLRAENAIGVLDSLAHAVTNKYVAVREPKRVVNWGTALLGRELPSGRIDDVLKTVAHSLTDSYVFSGDTYASGALEIFYKRPAKYTKELTQIAYSATFYLAYGIGEQDQGKTEMRKRAREVWGRALACADVVISEYFSVPKPASDEELKREQEILKGALTIIDSAVFQLYLLFRVDEHLVRENLPSLDDPQRRKLFDELDPVWKLLLAPVGPQHKGLLPAQTTHHLVELFRTTVSYDPTRVLQLTADLFKGFNMGYQSDPMAIGEVVRFAEIILADHKEILKDPTNAANLAFILDQFVEFGWPQAIQLLMKLDSAVR
ncbi:MAG: ATP-binding protein [Candidatus Acidiferrales bacterium]